MGRIKLIIQSPANVRPWPKRLTSSVPNIFIRRRVLLPLDGPHWRRLRPVRPLLLVVHPVVVVIVVAATRLPEHVVLLVKPEAVPHVGFKFVLTWKKVLGWKNYSKAWKSLLEVEIQVPLISFLNLCQLSYVCQLYCRPIVWLDSIWRECETW